MPVPHVVLVASLSIVFGIMVSSARQDKKRVTSTERAAAALEQHDFRIRYGTYAAQCISMHSYTSAQIVRRAHRRWRTQHLTCYAQQRNARSLQHNVY